MMRKAAVSSTRLSVKPRVLVVEPDIRLRGLLVDLLGEGGGTIESVTRGDEALRRLATPPQVDVVLADERVPDMTAIQMVAGLRALVTAHPVPLVMMLALRNDVLARSVDLVLMKPFGLDQLCEAVFELAQRGAAPVRGAVGE